MNELMQYKIIYISFSFSAKCCIKVDFQLFTCRRSSKVNIERIIFVIINRIALVNWKVMPFYLFTYEA